MAENLGYILLAHELIHADRKKRTVDKFGEEKYKYQSWRLFGKYPVYKTQKIPTDDLAVIGLKYNSPEDITENMIRAEHYDKYGEPLPLRGGY